MRCLLAGWVLGSLLLGLFEGTAESRTLSVEIRGQERGQLPVFLTEDGVGYVSLSRLARLLGVKAAWSDKGTRATFKVGTRAARLVKDRAQVVVQGKTVRLSAPVRVLSSGWAVPEEFLTKALPLLVPAVGVGESRPPPPKPRVKPARAAAALEDLRFRSYPSFTRVVLEASDPFEFELELGPSEVRVRLSGLAVEHEQAEQLRDGLIRGLSLERRGAEALLRVSLEAPLGEAKTSVLREPYRAVLDFHRARERADTLRTQAGPLKVIVLDAGHGGHDPGAVGPNGLQEKEVVLDVTLRVAKMLEEGLGVKVAFTRTGDYFVPLRDRTAFANAQRADLFVSIHANAHRASVWEGVETYFLSSEASDNDARQVAALENGVIQLETRPPRGNLDILKTILWDLAQSEFQTESSRLAEIVLDSMTGSLRIANRGVKQAGFYVLGGAAMPAILVEIGFVTNRKEERKLMDSRYREQVARAIYAGLAEYKRRYDQKMRAILMEGAR
ncbi:MAG: N-acetylmuramoyl-L-alanine amidase [Candidatus Rokubacteria bacterium]|nr:N-acetylmuramoyl-L-alanine amidase [Candidatus Rokubacteria bacterium]